MNMERSPRDAKQRKAVTTSESTYSSVVKRVRMVEELIVYQEYGMGGFGLCSYNHVDVRIVKP